LFHQRLFNWRSTFFSDGVLLNSRQLLNHWGLLQRNAGLLHGLGWLGQGLAPEQLLRLAGEGLHPTLQLNGAMAMHQAIA
jgi:hypothetical protein